MTSPRLVLLLSVVLVAVVLPGPPAEAEPAGFADTAGTIHEDAVTALVGLGIVQGCSSDRFCGRDPLTRGQVATMLVRALDLPAASDRTDRFRDTADDLHGASVDALAAEGLVAGCDDDRFCPGDPITREQLATMLQRAFDVPDAPADAEYFDDVAGPHEPAVRALAAAGVAAGCTDRLTSFCGGAGVQRAHAAMFLARTLGLVPAVELAPFEERRAEQDEIDRAEAELLPGQRAVEVALAQLGKPYRWGGSGPDAFDCSGLTSYAWAAAGVSLPRTSSQQYAATTRISRSELRPGDLVFYHSPISHVAMYIGDGRVVEAPNSGNSVRIREDGLTRRGVVGFGRP